MATTRVKYDRQPAYVAPKLDALTIPTVTDADQNKLDALNSALTAAAEVQPPSEFTANSASDADQGKYQWFSWSLQLSLSQIEQVTKNTTTFLKELDRIQQQVIQVLKILRLFNSDFKSAAVLIQFVVKRLAEILKKLIDSFTSTGVYFSLIMPDFDKSFPEYTIPVYGGYNEFRTKVNVACEGSGDPYAPRFDSDGDTVGGVILAMLGGVNDPGFLKDLYDNMEVLGTLLGFKIPKPMPPRSAKAEPGFYKDPSDKVRKMGVKISWEDPEGPMDSYVIHKGKNPKGVRKASDQISLVKIISGDTAPVFYTRLSDDVTEVKPISPPYTHSYVDFDVDAGQTYYYKVYLAPSSGYYDKHPQDFDLQNAPAASPLLSAKPNDSIPLSELDKYAQFAINGSLKMPLEFGNTWTSLSVRSAMGPFLDSVFKDIDKMVAQISGNVQTASDQGSRFIEDQAKKVEDMLQVIGIVSQIVQAIVNFKLRGTFMVLNLPPEKGGMRNFVDRFNKAALTGSTAQGSQANNSPNKAVATNEGIAQYTEQGISIGMIILYGAPSADTLKQAYGDLSPVDQGMLATSFDQTQKAVETLLKMLGLGKK